MILWIRCGDADGYNKMDSIEDAAEYLGYQKVDEIRQINRYSFHDRAEEYSGHNYISMFWGDCDAQASEGLTEDEVAEINRILSNGVTR